MSAGRRRDSEFHVSLVDSHLLPRIHWIRFVESFLFEFISRMLSRHNGQTLVEFLFDDAVKVIAVIV